MPRIKRIQTPGLIRHTMSRGNGGMRIYLDDQDYREWIHQLGTVCEEYEVDCWTYCAMPNHYHAVLVPTKENYSRAMQHLNGEYGKWWNGRHRRVGHTFQGRFKGQIVDTGQYLRTLLRYVARNPVRANLVDDPSKWKWSSYAAIVGLEPAPAFLKIEPVLAAFGPGSEAELRARFAAFVLGTGEDPLEERIRSNERILGEHAFKKAVRMAAQSENGADGSKNSADPESILGETADTATS